MNLAKVSVLAILCLGWGFSGPVSHPKGPLPILVETFDQDLDTGLARRLLNHRLVELEERAGPDGSRAIRVIYEGYEKGSERVVAHHPLPVPLGAATLVFDVRFSEDFQWTLGGKLHGLGPLHPVTGGGKRSPAAWSARIMWHGDGVCSTYLYDQSEDYQYGVGSRTEDPVFRKGIWHRVALQLRLNSPDGEDGLARILIDGRRVVETEGVVFRRDNGPETGIQQLLFSTFHGGNDRRWTPVDAQGNATVVHAWFDNFMLFPGIVDPPRSVRSRFTSTAAAQTASVF